MSGFYYQDTQTVKYPDRLAQGAKSVSSFKITSEISLKQKAIFEVQIVFIACLMGIFYGPKLSVSSSSNTNIKAIACHFEIGC